MNEDHPVRFSVDYPDRTLDRLTTFFRIFTVILAVVSGPASVPLAVHPLNLPVPLLSSMVPVTLLPLSADVVCHFLKAPPLNVHLPPSKK